MSARRPAWETCLDVESQDADHYHDYVNEPLFRVIEGTPRRVLELGCAGGMFGAALKARFPGAHVTGIEPGRAAAQKAGERIDAVVCSRLEDLDWSSGPVGEGGFDLVVASDVLEHVINPWQVLKNLKSRLAPGAQVVASIPNVRNIYLVYQLLAAGRWEYSERGLLDVTHLRFFTLGEIRRMLAETGYALEAYSYTVSRMLEEIHRAYQGRGPAQVKMGRLTLDAVTQDELVELCAEQFLVRARPA